MPPEDRTADENVPLVTCLVPLCTDLPAIGDIPRTRALLADIDHDNSR